MYELLKRPTFAAQEVQIFQVIQDWAKKNSVNPAYIEEVICQVRLPRLTVEQLLSIMQSGLMRYDLIFKAIGEKMNCSALRMFFFLFL